MSGPRFRCSLPFALPILSFHIWIENRFSALSLRLECANVTHLTCAQNVLLSFQSYKYYKCTSSSTNKFVELSGWVGSHLLCTHFVNIRTEMQRALSIGHWMYLKTILIYLSSYFSSFALSLALAPALSYAVKKSAFIIPTGCLRMSTNVKYAEQHSDMRLILLKMQVVRTDVIEHLSAGRIMSSYFG